MSIRHRLFKVIILITIKIIGTQALRTSGYQRLKAPFPHLRQAKPSVSV